MISDIPESAASKIDESVFVAAARAEFLELTGVEPAPRVLERWSRGPGLRASVESAYRAGRADAGRAIDEYGQRIDWYGGAVEWSDAIELATGTHVSQSAQRSGVAAQNLTEELS